MIEEIGKKVSNMNKNSSFKMRIVLDICLFGLVLFSPWWVTVVVISALILYYNHYYEALFAALMFDSLYGVQLVFFKQFEFVVTLYVMVFLMFSLFLKRRLAFYSCR